MDESGRSDRIARLRDQASRRQEAGPHSGALAPEELEARVASLAREAEARHRALRPVGTHKAPPPPPKLSHPPRSSAPAPDAEAPPAPAAPREPPAPSDSILDWELEIDSDGEDWEGEPQEELDKYIRELESDQLLSDVLNRGTNLQRYHREKEEALAEKEDEGVRHYVQNTGMFLELYKSMSEQEELLDQVRRVVGGFQEHLGGISGRLKELEQRTHTINMQKYNREQTQLHISPLAKKLDVVNDQWLVDITRVPHEAEGRDRHARQKDVDLAFLSAVRKLDEKISYVAEDPLLVGSELKQELEPKLNRAAAALSPKVLSFLRTKLHELREEGTNLRIRQQSLARRCAFAFRFLLHHGGASAHELRADYIDMMAKVHHRQLRNLWHTRAKPEVKVARPELVVLKDQFDAKRGVEAGETKRLRDRFSSGSGKQRGATVPFEQRVRLCEALIPGEELLTLDPTAMVGQPRTAAEGFLLMNAELVNAAVQEASFLSEFFGCVPVQRETILQEVIGRAHAYTSEKTLETIDQMSSDPAGILLLLRLSDSVFGFLLPETSVSPSATPCQTPRCGTPVSSSFPSPSPFGGGRSPQQPALRTSRVDDDGACTRFRTRQFRSQRLLMEHLRSVQQRLWDEYGKASREQLRAVRGAAAISFVPLKGESATSREAHSCTLRYASMVCDLHILNTLYLHGGRVSAEPAEGRGWFSDTVVADLRELRVEVLRLISALSERQQTATDRTVFAINNFTAVLDRFRERRVPDSVEDVAAFEAALHRQVQAYIVQEFQQTPFQQVQDFVDKHAAVAAEPVPATEEEYAENRRRVGIDTDGGQLSALVNNFSRTWLEGLQHANIKQGTHFPQSHAKQQVLRVFLTRVLELSESVRVLSYRCWAAPPFQAKLVSREVIKHTAAQKFSLG
eukprot:TRINITY_DN35921_c0_g1_i1.p1 TRINITY_DN35921_c0_g1~~TRINITY_DN35921_c0_g1_i1.p1  ORF type:complete len:912 (+),score=312.59 TRINITY_DN35921_c0_g1_i1:72-2807(+)